MKANMSPHKLKWDHPSKFLFLAKLREKSLSEISESKAVKSTRSSNWWRNNDIFAMFLRCSFNDRIQNGSLNINNL